MEEPWSLDTLPWQLDYWKSKDWDTLKERLNGLDKSGVGYNPRRELLFDNLRSLSVEQVRVVICGQDPYPDCRYATGNAFSIPRAFEKGEFPSSLRVIFRELSEDLAIKYPTHGDLQRWVEQGVLLWNVIPTCTRGVSRSHDWREYHALTNEVFTKILEEGRGTVFCFLGAVARRYADTPGQDNPNFPVICTGHPSPRGNINSKTPFTGSRMFSLINANLNKIGLEPIDWRLDSEAVVTPPVRRLDARDQLLSDPQVDGHICLRKSNRVLPNITGESVGRLCDKRGICIRE